MGLGLGLPCRSWKGLAICIRSSISLSCRRLAAAVSIIICSALIAPPTAREMLRACIACCRCHLAFCASAASCTSSFRLSATCAGVWCAVSSR